MIEADAANPGGYELVLDGGHNSYVDLRDPTHLEYAYTRWIADGIDAMVPPKAPLDAVFVGDAFGHHTVPWHLMTREWLDEVKRVLKPGGLYALNVIDFPPLELLKAEAAAAAQGSPHDRKTRRSISC